MALTPGTRLGPYEILSALGAGGMGEVYKARDTRLDRMVAVKVLLADLVADPDRRTRFEREARAIAGLSHPHICTVHDVGRHEVIDYLVMEYLDGETLADRLTRAKGPLPLEQVLTIGIHIADALDKAHRAGIVHRDLKPANVMLTKSGAKLLDFGLAKLRGPAGPITMSGMTAMGTATPATAQGTILGTIQYMAPEQVEGREADTRSDIWALGAVLYEMATGRRPFDGASAASIIGGILKDTPPAVSTRQPLAPLALDHLVERCLEKDADDRWQDAGDVKRELKWIGESGTAVTPVGARKRNPWIERAAWVTVTGAALIALSFLLRSTPAPATGDVVRLSILPPDKTLFTPQSATTVGVTQLALSPDGRAIVFVAAAPGAKPTLWLRSLDAVTAHSLPGTEGADSPFWSPNNRWIGYFADGKLKKIPASGGPSQEVAANVSDNRGASWGPDDTILFSTSATGIVRVSSSPGGMVTPVTELDASRQEGSHRFPQFLPDGRHFLFTVRSSVADQTGVYAGSLDGKTKKLLIPRNTTSALYAPSGHVLFLDGDTLMGQAFDAERLEPRGQAFVVEGGVGRSSSGYGSYSVSSTGTLAYAGTLSRPGQLTWFDQRGTPSDSVGSPADYADFRLSPDDTRLAASKADPTTGAIDIWIMDRRRGDSAQITFGGSINASAVWAPDGARVMFRTNRTGGMNEFYTKSAGGGGIEKPVLLQTVARASGVLTGNMLLWDWSRDGRHLLFSPTLSSDSDLWLMPLTGDAKPVRFLPAPGDQFHGNFSPDGKLVAYSSNESAGRFEVKVQTFPKTDRQWQVSTTGGYEPRWRADGREMSLPLVGPEAHGRGGWSRSFVWHSERTVSGACRRRRELEPHALRPQLRRAAVSHQYANRRSRDGSHHRRPQLDGRAEEVDGPVLKFTTQERGARPGKLAAMRRSCLVCVATVCCLARPPDSGFAQTANELFDRYSEAVRAYQRGDERAQSVLQWSRRDLQRVVPQVLTGRDRSFAEAAVVLHTELAVYGTIEGLSAGPLHLDLAETLVRSMRSPQQVSALEFSERWYGFAASLFLGRTNPEGARLFIERGLKLFPRSPRLHMVSGVIQELVAHLASPECTGPRCDSVPERSPVSSRLSFAEAEYRRALEGDPRLMEARLRLGRVLFLRNQRTPARQELDAVTKDSTDARLLYLGHLFLGGLDVFENDLPRARREYEAALQAAPEYLTPYIALSFVEQMSGRESHAREVLAISATLPKMLVNDPWRDYQNGGLDLESLQWLRARVHR